MAKDLLVNESDDLIINTVTGDFDVGFSDNQHIGHILKANKGNYYQSPEIGVYAPKYLLSKATKASIKNDIKENLELDDFIINEIQVDRINGNLTIVPDARRKEE